jgi:arsenate reductase (glutaredoxin)
MSALPESDDQILLLHNPRCSKSRAVRALLEERGVAFAERRYLEAPLARGELAELAARLGLPPRDWVRTGEGAYAEAGIGAEASEAELFDAMARRPILMERPILVRGRRAVVGRPPEKVLSLLGP